MDMVNSPSHYNQSGIECIDAIEAMTGEGFEYHLQATAVKYLWRYRYKGKALEDLKKARWYLTSSSASTRTDMQHNSDFRYDLKRGRSRGVVRWFADLRQH